MYPVYTECQRWLSGLCASAGDHTGTLSALQSLAAQSGSFGWDLSFRKAPV